MEAQNPQGNVFHIATHKQLWEHMNVIAKTFIASRAMPPYLANPEQAMVVLQAGQEMGLQFMESIKYLYLINGQIALTGQGAARKLRDAGYRVEYKDGEDQCTVTVFQGDEKIAEETVTYEEAAQSGYTTYYDKQTGKQVDKIAWRKGMNRKLKLRYLGLSTLIKTNLPEVLGSAMDIKEVAEDYPREVIEATVTDKVDLTKDTPKSSLNEFLDQKKQETDKHLVKEGKGKEEAVEGQIVESKPTLDDAEKKAQAKPVDNTKLVDDMLEVAPKPETEGETVDPRLVAKRKEFFATATDLGIDAETAKSEAKKYYGDKESFNDIGYIDLSAYVRAMKTRLQQKKQEAENGK